MKSCLLRKTNEDLPQHRGESEAAACVQALHHTISCTTIEEIRSEAGAASTVTEETVSRNVKDKLMAILENVREITKKVENLAAASEEQSASAEEMTSVTDGATKAVNTIAEQMKEMATTIREFADSSQEAGASSEELTSIVDGLIKEIKKFKV